MAIIFENQDNVNIAAAIAAGGNVWSNPLLFDVKRKIKDHYIINELPKCCYCSRLFVGEFRMVIDVEHILPQSKYSSLRFEELNLNVACKRCNMEIKRSRVDFIIDETIMGTNYYQSQHYKLIHPNIDKYEEHLKIVTGRNGNAIVNKYIILTDDKGQYTYDYFELKELEINNLNQAQGFRNISTLSREIPDILRNQILKILSKI